MKTFLKYFAVFLTGATLTQIPDLVCLYADKEQEPSFDDVTAGHKDR